MTLISPSGGRILWSIDGPVGWITIDNQARRNALSFAMWPMLADALAQLADDDAIRVVVMHGAGGKAFASGADISEFDAVRNDAEQEVLYRRQSAAARSAIDALGKPLIAMIDGFCIGGGLALALGADLRVASTWSQFGIPAAKLGVAYPIEPVERLTRLVGPSRAKEILFTGRRLGAEEAFAIGLIDRVVPSADLLAVTRALAGEIAANAPLSVRASKVMVSESARDPAQRDIARTTAAYDKCFDSADYQEGRSAFMSKRTPRFVGR